MKKGQLIVSAIIILGLAAGGYVLLKNSSADDNDSQDNTTRSQTENPGAAGTSDSPVAATITYDGTSFSPASVTVKSGDKVTVKNSSSKELDFDSDPHPVHTDDEDLNAGGIAPGKSDTFTVTQKGEYGYHNHLNSTQKGTITVE